jgi:hypothetical protein
LPGAPRAAGGTAALFYNSKEGVEGHPFSVYADFYRILVVGGAALALHLVCQRFFVASALSSGVMRRIAALISRVIFVPARITLWNYDAKRR